MVYLYIFCRISPCPRTWSTCIYSLGFPPAPGHGLLLPAGRVYLHLTEKTSGETLYALQYLILEQFFVSLFSFKFSSKHALQYCIRKQFFSLVIFLQMFLNLLWLHHKFSFSSSLFLLFILFFILDFIILLIHSWWWPQYKLHHLQTVCKLTRPWWV